MERGRGTAAEGDRDRQKGIRHSTNRGPERRIKRDRPTDIARDRHLGGGGWGLGKPREREKETERHTETKKMETEGERPRDRQRERHRQTQMETR